MTLLCSLKVYCLWDEVKVEGACAEGSGGGEGEGGGGAAGADKGAEPREGAGTLRGGRARSRCPGTGSPGTADCPGVGSRSAGDAGRSSTGTPCILMLLKLLMHSCQRMGIFRSP